MNEGSVTVSLQIRAPHLFSFRSGIRSFASKVSGQRGCSRSVNDSADSVSVRCSARRALSVVSPKGMSDPVQLLKNWLCLMMQYCLSSQRKLKSFSICSSHDRGVSANVRRTVCETLSGYTLLKNIGGDCRRQCRDCITTNSYFVLNAQASVFG